MVMSKVLACSLVAALALPLAATGCAEQVEPPEAQLAADGPTRTASQKIGTDDWKNCVMAPDGDLNDQDCRPLHSGTDTDPFPGDWMYSIALMSKDQRATVLNTGSSTIRVFVEQGLGWSTPVRVVPGQKIDVGPIDDEWWSYNLYSIVMKTDDGYHDLDPATTSVRLHIGAFTPEHNACNDACMTSFEGCLQGCSMNDHGNSWCPTGCSTEAELCLNRCSKASASRS